MSTLPGHSKLNIVSDNTEASCATSGDSSEIFVSPPKKRKRDGSNAGDIPVDPTPVQPDIAPSVETDPRKNASPKKKKKNGDGAFSSTPISFVFASKDLKGRTVPVSLYSLRSVVMTIMGDKSMAQHTKFISAPLMPSVKRVLVLHVPGITSDVLGMPAPPPYMIQRKNVHPSSMFSGGAMNLASSSTPSSVNKLSKSPAFPLPIQPRYPETKLPAMSKLFSHGLPTRCSGDGTKIEDVIEAFMMGPTQKSTEHTNGHSKKSTPNQKITLESLLLNQSQILREGLLQSSEASMSLDASKIPMDTNISQGVSSEADLHHVANGWTSYLQMPTRTSAWVQAPAPIPEAEENQIVLALDCEMVDTVNGKELARLAVIDFWDNKLLLDLFVKPEGKVTDYLTQFSGITPELLESVTTTLANAQEQILALMRDSRCILIGHHLSNDLSVLKLVHTRCIDTSVVFENIARPTSKPSLKWLAQRYLGKTIQETRVQGPALTSSAADSPAPMAKPKLESRGHSPIEDAQACVELVKKKLERGMTFGKAATERTSIFETVLMWEMRGAFVGPASQKYGSMADSRVNGVSDDEVISSVIDALQSHEFVYGHLPNLSRTLKWTHHATSVTEIPLSPENQVEVDIALKSLDSAIDKLIAHLPDSTALIMYTGCGDPRGVGILHRKKAAWENKIRIGIKNDDMPEAERWTAADSELLNDLVEKARAGLAFFSATTPGQN